MINGIFLFTGEQGAGKTTALLTQAQLKGTVFFNDDVKNLNVEGIDPGELSKEFGQYHDLVDKCRDLTFFQMREYVLEKIDKIRPGEYQAILFDTWTRFGKALRIWGKLNAYKFRERASMSPGQKYLYGQQWGEGDRYEVSIISKLSQLTPYVGLSAHLADSYRAEKKTGAMRPDTNGRIHRVFNSVFWLRREAGLPIALVLKSLSENRLENGMLKPINLLPRKITPQDGEENIWDSIRRYRREPFGNREPGLEETPTPDELAVLNGTLTDDQKKIWEANLAITETEGLLTDSGEIAFAREFLAKKENSDASPFELKIALKNAGHDIDMKEVVKLEEGIKNE